MPVNVMYCQVNFRFSPSFLFFYFIPLKVCSFQWALLVGRILTYPPSNMSCIIPGTMIIMDFIPGSRSHYIAQLTLMWSWGLLNMGTT